MSIFFVDDRPEDSHDGSECFSPLSPPFCGREDNDISYFEFTSEGAILSGPHGAATSSLPSLNPCHELQSFWGTSYKTDVLPVGNGSLPPDIPFDELYANGSGLHAGAVVQGHESLTVHQISEISYGSDAALILTPQMSPPIFPPLTPRNLRSIASAHRQGMLLLIQHRYKTIAVPPMVPHPQF
ncbi:hypothetical protein BU15DRAFT_64935 [Melanogaster broomeanus]|nr:hypothetical protein BU15DRAFT_64935 [Melanogaster broomeanus]